MAANKTFDLSSRKRNVVIAYNLRSLPLIEKLAITKVSTIVARSTVSRFNKHKINFSFALRQKMCAFHETFLSTKTRIISSPNFPYELADRWTTALEWALEIRRYILNNIERKKNFPKLVRSSKMGWWKQKRVRAGEGSWKRKVTFFN